MSIRSSLGAQIERLELYAFDEDGQPIPKRPRSDWEIPVRETRATPNTLPTRMERAEALTRAISRMTERERQVWQLRHGERSWRRRERIVAVTDLPAMLEAGWHCVRTEDASHVVVGWLYPRDKTLQEIALELQLSVSRVGELLASAERKLESAL